jgi:hypothetical protein
VRNIEAGIDGSGEIGLSPEAEPPVSDDELFDIAYALQVEAGELRARMDPHIDHAATVDTTANRIIKRLLTERGRDDLATELDARNHSDRPTGARQIYPRRGW